MDENNLVDGMPSTIGRYKVLEGIGFGAMGAVYRAFDPLIKRALAIKTIRLDIPRQSPQYKSFIERFYHEARISGTLSHPNIVTLFDIGEDGGVPYLAMEFVEGETIALLLERGTRFKPEKVIGLVSQIAAALDYAHSKGVIHRDVKPANLMLYEGDRVKVADFGIAKLVDAEMTQSGTLLGTPSYMSPEQAMGEKLDGRSDIFSLGVCAFEMLSGEQPFPGNNVTSILYKLVHVEPIEPSNLETNGLIPQKWQEVFGKVLAKKPEDRYQTAGAFVRDLEYCLGSWFGALGSEETIATAPVLESQRTAAIPRPTPPPPAEEEVPATVILRASVNDSWTPAPEALAADDVRTVMMKAPVTDETHTVKLKAPIPPMESEDSPATVVLKAGAVSRPVSGPGSDSSTVNLKAPAAAKVLPTAPPPAAEADSATVVLRSLPEPGDVPATVVMQRVDETVPAKAPGKPVPPAEAKARPRPPAPPAAVPGPPDTPSSTEILDRPPVPPPARRSGVSPVVLLGGAAALFVVAAVVVVWLLLKSRSTEEPTPAPTATLEAVVAPTAEPPPSVAPAPAGVIRIETVPPGAVVNLNGETKGASPMELTGLGFGTYEVKVDLKGYESRTQNVAVTEQAPQVDVKVALTRPAPTQGVAEILSTPFGAAVSVDGASVGNTPLTDLKLKPGPRKVDITKDDYEAWSGIINVQAGKRARVDAQLKAVVKVVATPVPVVETLDVNRIYKDNEVDTKPRRTSGTTASYPDNAPKLRSGDSASVALEFVVTENGEVTEIKVIESAGKVIDEAVTAAIRSWKYSPGVKKGTKVKVRMPFRQTFRAG
jgi:TonB family protein